MTRINKSPPFGLYVHIPFCPQRCPYCGFAVVTGNDHLRERYVEALCAEISQAKKSTTQQRPLDTVFVGGGTPSQLEAEQLGRLLSAAARTYGCSLAFTQRFLRFL